MFSWWGMTQLVSSARRLLVVKKYLGEYNVKEALEHAPYSLDLSTA
jgi:hypothetical protein